MKTKDILNIEPDKLMRMNRKELANVTSLLARTANKRVKRLQAKEMQTPAFQGAEKSGGKFSVKGKNINQLRSEFYRVSKFLTAKTSTIKGAKKVQQEVEERIGGALGPQQMKDFWSAYRKLEELEPNFLRLYGSQQMQQHMRQEFVDNGLDVDELVQAGMDEIEREYDEREDEIDDMGEFFEI